MTIATNPHFDAFVQGVRLSRERGESGIPYWKTEQRGELFLQPPMHDITLESVLKIVTRGLESAGCKVNRQVAVATLGVLAAVCQDNESPCEVFNYLLLRVTQCTLHVHIILPSRCDSGYSITLGDCHIKSFDPDQLLYWASKGKSSYRYDVASLRGMTAITPAPSSLSLVDFDQVSTSGWAAAARKLGSDWPTLSDAYFHAVFEQQLEAIPEEVRRATQVLEAGGFIHVDMESLVNSILSIRLGLFRWRTTRQEQRSWAVMNQQAEVTINLPPHDRLIKARKWLEEELGYTGISADTALNRTLETFCTLMQRGRNHQMSGARDEAALYWVIALDFLFGTKAGVTDSVAERVAVLTHMAENRTYAEQNKRMRELYDARSRYVHQGKPIDELQASEIERVASQVLWSFLSVSADAVFATTDEWLREVDFVQAAIQAGREVSEADLRGIGVRTDLAAIERCEIPKKA